MKKRLIVVDDHTVVRVGLQLIFDETPDMEIVDEAKNSDELLKKLENSCYDGVILDVHMPNSDILETIKTIKLKYPDLPIIIFSMNTNDVLAVRLLSKGAHAYLNKETPTSELITAIRTVVIKRKKYINHYQADLLFEIVTKKNKTNSPLHELLTDREFQILCFLAMGYKRNEIAQKLGISKNTVSNHRKNILNKLGFISNAELTQYAIEQGFIQ